MAEEIKKENENGAEEEEDILILTDEEGVDTKFQFLGNVKLNDNVYCALVPLEGEEADGESYVILKVAEGEDGEEILVTVDDDDEFEDARDAIEDELFTDIDYDG